MKRRLLGLLILSLVAALAEAQTKAAISAPRLVLEFVNGPELGVTALDGSSKRLGRGLSEGDEIFAGSTIVTGVATTAEFRLVPNGSMIKLSPSTTFLVKGLAGAAKEKNIFELAAGKARTLAAKDGSYELTSRSVMCSVRGTDFSLAIQEGSKALLAVAKGLVQFDRLDPSGASIASIPVAAGQMADAMAPSFEAFAYGAAYYAQEFGDMAFEKLDEGQLPERAGEPGEAQAPAQGAQASTAQAAPPHIAQEQATPQASLAAPQNEGSQPSGEPATPQAPPADTPFMKWLRESLAMEIGSETMPDGVTYSKAVLQPVFQFGAARLGLYLPIIFSSNLFDPSDWYHPGGNDEWSFGWAQFSRGEYFEGAIDFAKDLALKLKYFEYGEQLRDPFFLKAGNLDDLSLGHGLLMRNYANDTEFPALRRLGFELGLEASGGGFELVANDLTDPEILGARLFVRPFKGWSLGIGVSGVADLSPGSVIPSLKDGGMALLGSALDLDLPILRSEAFGLRAFADAGAFAPYLRSALGALSPGLQYQLVYDPRTGTIGNWGASSGLIGSLAFFDWRLEYRYFTGAFRPSLFDGTYDRMRGQYAAQYVAYLLGSSGGSADSKAMGVYGEGGFRLFEDRLSFSLGYMWPWSFAAGSTANAMLAREALANDEFHARLALKKGLIPFFDLAGAITYDRRGLAKALAEGNFGVLDANTLFGGEIDLPIPKAPGLDLALTFKTMPLRNASGSIVYEDEARGIPKLKPSIGIETRFHL
jgi:FecR protein.